MPSIFRNDMDESPEFGSRTYVGRDFNINEIKKKIAEYKEIFRA